MEKDLAADHWDVIRDENGNRVYEGFVKNAKPYGPGRAFFQNDVTYQEGIFGIKGLICGKEYYPNGELRFEGLYGTNYGYGPNYPVQGKFYDRCGVLAFEGKVKLKRSGLGYPTVLKPVNYGPVQQSEAPKVDWTMWWDDVDNNCQRGDTK